MPHDSLTQLVASMLLDSPIDDAITLLGHLTTQHMNDMPSFGPRVLNPAASQLTNLPGPSNAKETKAAEIPEFIMLSPIPGLHFTHTHQEMDEKLQYCLMPPV
ncbi:hypothetical protein A0H81_12993 [Grifola frondosa]|uniref:Uncharacterized protein n=1 Tax=Grifola frondosa TaxID=5627 RepID=A0A1C7LS51_GRIFR|nr:hypothetical protein A0H81_12993 [Grifola frondosa]